MRYQDVVPVVLPCDTSINNMQVCSVGNSDASIPTPLDPPPHRSCLMTLFKAMETFVTSEPNPPASVQEFHSEPRLI
jgi:hypothetical protein